MTGRARPRAQEVDRHIGARLRELRVTAGLSQHILADLIGVTCQQVHKYESGASRMPASRLYAIAAVLDIEIGAFFDGPFPPEWRTRSPEQRVLVDLARDYRNIGDAKHREVIRLLARILSSPAKSSDASDVAAEAAVPIWAVPEPGVSPAGEPSAAGRADLGKRLRRGVDKRA